MFIPFVQNPTKLQWIRNFQGWAMYSVACVFFLWMAVNGVVAVLDAVGTILLVGVLLLFALLELKNLAIFLFIVGMIALGNPLKPSLIGFFVAILIAVASIVVITKLMQEGGTESSFWNSFGKLLLALICPFVPLIADTRFLIQQRRARNTRPHLRLVR